MSALAEEIAGDVDTLARDYPRGATPTDLAGYYGVPLARIDDAIRALDEDGVALPFLRRSAPKDAAAVALGKRGAAARMEALTPERRTEIAREAAVKRWAPPSEEDVRERVRARREAPAHVTVEEAEAHLRAALPVLAELYPHGASVPELAEALSLPIERVYKVTTRAAKDGWCEHVKSYGERRSGYLCVFAGMTVCQPGLTDLQARVYAWITERADDEGFCEVRMNECARDLDMKMINDKLDSMERKGYLARMTLYPREGVLKTSPTYKVLPLPQPRKPNLYPRPASVPSFFAIDVDTRGLDAVSAEPISVRRARDRKHEIEAELAEINAFLATFARLSK